MKQHSFKWNKLVMTVILVGFNLLVFAYLVHQVNTERKGYLSLRSEDGFLLMESLIHQLESVYNTGGDIHKQYTVLEYLSRYEDLDYIRFESTEQVFFQSENFNNLNLTALPDDGEIMEAVYSNQPFTRIISLNDFETLECVWPFYKKDKFVGVLRLGLSLKFVNILNDHFRHTTFIAVLFLLMFDGLIVLAWAQNMKMVQEGETFHTVMNGIYDGVLIIKKDGQIIRNKRVIDIEEHFETGHSFLSLKDGYNRITKNGRTYLALKSTLKEMNVIIVRDITVENIAEINKEREKRMFSLGKLSSAFAHEIRNPLNTISMIIQQIESSMNLSDHEKKLMVIVDDEIKRLNSHVDDYMNIAKRPAIKTEKIDFKSELEDLMMFFEADAESKNVHFILKLEHEVSELFLDREKFKGIMINLIKNSMNAGASEIIFKTCYQHPYFRLTVSDNGEGMDSETLDKAFDLYFTTGESGTGLGLPYVQRVITAHGGMVKMESKRGQGTDTFIYLPAEGEKDYVSSSVDC